MTGRRVFAVLAISVAHDRGSIVDDDAVLAELSRQVNGLGPLRVPTVHGGISVWHVVDVLAEPTP